MADFNPIKMVSDALTDALTSDTVRNFGNATKDALNQVTSPETKSWADKQKALQTNYDYKFIHFPADLATGKRNPYYMTFYINQQDSSKLQKTASQGPPPLSTVDINARKRRTLAKNFGKTKIGFGRKTHRTALAIRLYIPDTLSWSYANSFKDVNLSGLPGMGIAQAISSIPALHDSMTKSHQDGSIMGLLASLDSPAMRSAAGPLAEIIGEATGAGADVALQALGIAVNPQVDVIYESPSLREFMFDFLFAARDAKEAAIVAEIVKLFKLHSAPEMHGGGMGFGRYFVPPSEFDIEFSVDTMGKISTCVLKNITLDYAPSGSAFYENGQPVYTRMTLQFKELEFITKELVQEGF